MALIKPGKKTDEVANDLGDPYLNAQRKWNECFGDYIAQRNQWRATAFGCIAITVIAVIGNVWQSTQTKIQPYLVEIDKSGSTVRAQQALPGEINDDLIRAAIAQWIQDWRTVSVDASIENALVNRVYAHLSDGSPAYNTITSYQQQHDPYVRAAKGEIVSVEVLNVLRTTKDSFQVEWRDKVRDRHGLPLRTETYKASLTTVLIPPTNEAELMQNAMGLYFPDLSFTQELQ